MSKVDEIINKYKSQSKLANFVKTVDIKQVAYETAIAFTKWKDENYYYNSNEKIYLKKSKDNKNPIFKTLDQLFEEWNNLNG